ncbi:hypothetical protein D0T53_12430 [Dysgonomonas sp. 216]|uniref:hypothetical protein n=1 Tax=Dysgonomonas sp. 216 TaxID=2302934 RepID=UPI0013D29F11|nr:hypothetical protein [Dysgonomonas sp. 216]NDW19711.1 hypothetical protein [Dysgonomonas sp. 216]
MTKSLQFTLVEIAKALNTSEILWSVGASVLLYKYGLTSTPKDIDISVSVQDISIADKILSSMGEKMKEKKSEIYLTEYFYEYIINGINVDLMAGFKIKTKVGVFEYQYDKLSVPHLFEIDGILTPFSTLEEWYVLYQLMPDKEAKVRAIKEYFNQKGIQYPELLKRIQEDANNVC